MCSWQMGFEWTYTLPVFIRHVTVLQRKFNLLLELFRELIVTVNHLGIASRGLDEVVNLCRCDAAPGEVNTERSPAERVCLPVLVLPRLMLFDGDLDGITEFALHNLDGVVLAFFVDATSTCDRVLGYVSSN